MTGREKREILTKLNQAVVFENFLNTKYIGQKRFSLEGLETLPPLVVKYMGVLLKELDLGKVFSRKPKLVLVDELAHTDAPGLRITSMEELPGVLGL